MTDRLKEIQGHLDMYMGLDRRDFAAYAYDDLEYLLGRVRELESGLREYADHTNWGEKDGHAVFLRWENQPDKWVTHPWKPAQVALAGEEP